MSRLQKDLKNRRIRRKRSIRKKVYGTAENLRLTVYKGGSNIYAQLINDLDKKTVISASTIDKDVKGQITADMNKTAQAQLVGKILGERATAAGIKSVGFDRNGFLFTGRVKALADAAREAGLEF